MQAQQTGMNKINYKKDHFNETNKNSMSKKMNVFRLC